jgi:hypothetical protein
MQASAVSDPTGLQTELQRPEYHNALVIAASEHKNIKTIVQNLLSANGGDKTTVPKHGDDFDRIFAATISWTGDATNAAFARKHQNSGRTAGHLSAEIARRNLRIDWSQECPADGFRAPWTSHGRSVGDIFIDGSYEI